MAARIIVNIDAWFLVSGLSVEREGIEAGLTTQLVSGPSGVTAISTTSRPNANSPSHGRSRCFTTLAIEVAEPSCGSIRNTVSAAASQRSLRACATSLPSLHPSNRAQRPTYRMDHFKGVRPSPQHLPPFRPPYLFRRPRRLHDRLLLFARQPALADPVERLFHQPWLKCDPCRPPVTVEL